MEKAAALIHCAKEDRTKADSAQSDMRPAGGVRKEGKAAEKEKAERTPIPDDALACVIGYSGSGIRDMSFASGWVPEEAGRRKKSSWDAQGPFYIRRPDTPGGKLLRRRHRKQMSRKAM